MPVGLIMTVVRNTWQVATFTGRFIILGLLVAAFSKRYRDRGDLREALQYFGDIVMQQRRPVVYGLVAAGIVHALAAGSLQLPLSTLVVVGVLGYMLYRVHVGDEPGDLREVNPYIFLPFYAAAGLIAIASVLTTSVLLNSLAAVALFGIIFWRL